jgi:hypothetical protein
VVWPQNNLDGFRWFGLKTSGDGFCQFGLKTSGDSFSRFGLKIGGGCLVELQNQGGGGFFGLGLKTGSYEFSDLGLKITATVSWFEPQNHVGFSLSVAPQNRRREVGAGHVLISSSLLGVEASLARVSQSSLKTGGGATTGGARGTIAEVASEVS